MMRRFVQSKSHTEKEPRVRYLGSHRKIFSSFPKQAMFWVDKGAHICRVGDTEWYVLCAQAQRCTAQQLRIYEFCLSVCDSWGESGAVTENIFSRPCN